MGRSVGDDDGADTGEDGKKKRTEWDAKVSISGVEGFSVRYL